MELKEKITSITKAALWWAQATTYSFCASLCSYTVSLNESGYNNSQISTNMHSHRSLWRLLLPYWSLCFPAKWPLSGLLGCFSASVWTSSRPTDQCPAPSGRRPPLLPAPGCSEPLCAALMTGKMWFHWWKKRKRNKNKTNKLIFKCKMFSSILTFPTNCAANYELSVVMWYGWGSQGQSGVLVFD